MQKSHLPMQQHGLSKTEAEQKCLRKPDVTLLNTNRSFQRNKVWVEHMHGACEPSSLLLWRLEKVHDNNSRPEWKISGGATLALSGGLTFQRSATVTASPHKGDTVVVRQPPALSRSWSRRPFDKKMQFPKICLHAQWASLKTHAA